MAAAATAMSAGADQRSAEVAVAAPDLTVVQGSTTSFTAQVGASGRIGCDVKPDRPASATIATRYVIDAGGLVSADDPGQALPFFRGAPGPSRCEVSWTEAPLPYTVSARLIVADATPLGTYVVSLPAATTGRQGRHADALVDAVPTTIAVTVTAAAVPATAAAPAIAAAPATAPAPQI
ncbi:MAG: hypothetical protein M3296_04140, partial [Actinomycetota bacterium]|nr:hypothetical protein [Actinomycetota bacterium]